MGLGFHPGLANRSEGCRPEAMNIAVGTGNNLTVRCTELRVGIFTGFANKGFCLARGAADAELDYRLFTGLQALATNLAVDNQFDPLEVVLFLHRMRHAADFDLEP